MKLLISLGIALCLTVHHGHSQPAKLKVGDPAPELSVFKWIKGKPSVPWKNDRMYVIEFGATWCKPCAAAIPALSAMADKYQGQVEVISLFVMELNRDTSNYEKPSYLPHVENYVRKRADMMKYFVGVDDPKRKLQREWLEAAGLTGIPHMFLIDRNGKVAWMGGSINTLDKEIQSLQEGGSKSSDDQTSSEAPVLIEEEEMDVFFRSVLSRYDGKSSGRRSNIFIQSAYWLKPDSMYDKYEDRVDFSGGSIGQLYYMAYADTFSNQVPMRNYLLEYPDTVKNPYTNNSYGKYWYEPVLEVKDKSPFEYSWKSMRNRYDYHLKVPKGTGTSAFLQSCARKDLENYFGYEVVVETRSMPVWILTAPDKRLALSKLKSQDQSAKIQVTTDEAGSTFKNAVTRDVIWWLGAHYGYGSHDYGRVAKPEQYPYIDHTGITYKIDFTFDRNLSFEQIKTHLRSLGLHLEKGSKLMKVVVIRDPRI